jgi:hypothetical protein
VNRIEGFFLIAILISFLFIMLTPINSTAAENVEVYVDPPEILNQTLVPGSIFNVSVKVDNVPASPGLAGVEFMLTYDPILLSATFLTEVVFHNVTPQSEWDNIWRIQHKINDTAGLVSYAYTWQDYFRAADGGYAPISGNQTIATIGFEVKDTGECVLGFDTVKLGDASYPISQPIPLDAVNGFFSNSAAGQAHIHVHVTPPQLSETQVSGSIFDFAVRLDGTATSIGIVAASFTLNWDPALLEAVNMTEVMFHEATPQDEWNNINMVHDEINNTNGYVVYECEFFNVDRAISLGYAPILGDHTLAIIAFKVKEIGKTPLHFTESNATGARATPCMCITHDGVFKNLLRGDLNEDNSVDIYDALVASQAFGLSPANTKWNSAADIDRNGVVDIYDIIMLVANFGHHA